MKNLVQKILIVLAVIISYSSKAQTVDILSVYDSTSSGVPICSAPASVGVTVYGQVTGYNPLIDSIDVQYFWDDGTDTTQRVNIYDFTLDYFYTGMTHTYTSPGIFDVLVIATGPGGIADTMTNTPIYVGSGCVTVDGYCYYDNNTNCTFDSGDDSIVGIPLIITDASGNLIGYAYTNSSGYYSTTVPTGLTGLQISTSLYYASALITAACPVSGSYTFNSTTGMSFDFGMDCGLSGYDLYVSSSSSRLAAPGSDGWISLYAGNFSCTASASTITLTLDSQVSYVGMNSGPAPTTVVGNVLTWSSTMPASFYWYGGFYVNVKINTNIGAEIFCIVYRSYVSCYW